MLYQCNSIQLTNSAGKKFATFVIGIHLLLTELQFEQMIICFVENKMTTDIQ